jgi:D-glycero-alpha-D-manno-heptose 1-phosphate guanylyltransferase
MEAVILAGGLGTRLRSRIEDIPKPMAPVAGRPFLAWILDRLAGHGFTRVVLSVGYLRDVIIDTFGKRHGTVDLAYSVEEQPLGTGGALRRALDKTGGGAGPVWVMNGDSMVRLPYAEMLADHAPRQDDPLAITMALVAADDATRYGAVEVTQGRVASFSAAGTDGPSLINAGVYLVHPRLFAASEMPATFSFERDFLAAHVDRLDIRAFLTDAWFIDIGVPADYDRAQTAVEHFK